ncbi:MAG: thiamine phosphate synthase [Clostridiales Family XIII bacterium]|jgi:thiamine-phosphate pyrophosphorylase|nr:thiamine phosphate synthase [Clostridiales Family XIII bacterium]
MFEIIAVTDRLRCEGDFMDRIEGIAAAGASAVILREKDLGPNEYGGLLREAARRCARHGAELIAHGFIDEALDAGCGRIQLPMAAFMEGRGLLRPRGGLRAGVSVHSLNEALRAVALGAEWLLAGHIFETDSKRGLPPRGLRFLAEICRLSQAPVYAIGGISERNIGEVLDAGAAGACLMSPFMAASDPGALVRGLKASARPMRRDGGNR